MFLLSRGALKLAAQDLTFQFIFINKLMDHGFNSLCKV